MSFFDVPGRPPPQAPPRYQRQEWEGPSEGILPGRSAQRPVLAHTDTAHLMVERILVYPNGLDLTMGLRLRDYEEVMQGPWDPFGIHMPHQKPEDSVKLGLLLGDGTRWTNLGWDIHQRPDWRRPPVILHRSSVGGLGLWTLTVWIWPLPREGPIKVFAAWPDQGIEETSVTIDTTELGERATEAKHLWPV